MLDTGRLSGLFGAEITDGSWWSGVQHGIGLLGLCVPVSYKQGISMLHIASSHTEEFGRAWGSHPEIDNEVAWAGTQSHHDGFELSRQGKIERIISYTASKNDNPPIRACHQSTAGDNCGECEKCCRTIMGILIAGGDPEAYGFDAREGIYGYIQSRLESGAWELGYDEVFMWRDIQNHLPAPETIDDPETAAFVRWFENINVRVYRAPSDPGTTKRALRDALIQNFPYGYYDLASRTYSTLFPS